MKDIRERITAAEDLIGDMLTRAGYTVDYDNAQQVVIAWEPGQDRPLRIDVRI